MDRSLHVDCPGSGQDSLENFQGRVMLDCLLEALLDTPGSTSRILCIGGAHTAIFGGDGDPTTLMAKHDVKQIVAMRLYVCHNAKIK